MGIHPVSISCIGSKKFLGKRLCVSERRERKGLNTCLMEDQVFARQFGQQSPTSFGPRFLGGNLPGVEKAISFYHLLRNNTEKVSYQKFS